MLDLRSHLIRAADNLAQDLGEGWHVEASYSTQDRTAILVGLKAPPTAPASPAAGDTDGHD